MKIYLHEYKKVLDHLVSDHQEGYEYFSFLIGGEPVQANSIGTYWDHYEAQEYCSYNFNENDFFIHACMPILPVSRCMLAALDDKSLLIEKDGIVDISAMVDLHYERLCEKAAIIDQNLAQSQQKELMTNENKTELLEVGIGSKLSTRSEEDPSTHREPDGLHEPSKKIPIKKIHEISPDKRIRQMKRRK